MAYFDYNLTLHCAGSSKYIGAFKELVKKAQEGGTLSGWNIYPEDSPISLYCEIESTSGGPEEFLPLMSEFTNESGAPLGFFIALHEITNSGDDSYACGYIIYNEDGEVEAQETFSFEPFQFEDEEEPLSAAQNAKNQAHETRVKGSLYSWYKRKGMEYLEDNKDSNETIERYLEAVKEDSWALRDVPENLITHEMCLEAVKNDGETLELVPNDLKTAGICLEAVKNDSYAFNYVPEHLKTGEICMITMKDYGDYLEFVPEHLKTFEVCLEAVKNNGEALEYVPDKFRRKIKDELGIDDGNDGDDDSSDDEMEDTAQYYISIDGEQAGPFEKTVIAGKIAGGHLGAETLVWKDGMESWKAAGEMEEFAVLFAKIRDDAKKTEEARKIAERKKAAEQKEAARRKPEAQKPEPAPVAENAAPPKKEAPPQAAAPQTTKSQLKQAIISVIVGGIILGFIAFIMDL